MNSSKHPYFVHQGNFPICWFATAFNMMLLSDSISDDIFEWYFTHKDEFKEDSTAPSGSTDANICLPKDKLSKKTLVNFIHKAFFKDLKERALDLENLRKSINARHFYFNIPYGGGFVKEGLVKLFSTMDFKFQIFEKEEFYRQNKITNKDYIIWFPLGSMPFSFSQSRIKKIILNYPFERDKNGKLILYKVFNDTIYVLESAALLPTYTDTHVITGGINKENEGYIYDSSNFDKVDYDWTSNENEKFAIHCLLYRKISLDVRSDINDIYRKSLYPTVYNYCKDICLTLNEDDCSNYNYSGIRIHCLNYIKLYEEQNQLFGGVRAKPAKPNKKK
jgi:hypothetical protein